MNIRTSIPLEAHQDHSQADNVPMNRSKKRKAVQAYLRFTAPKNEKDLPVPSIFKERLKDLPVQSMSTEQKLIGDKWKTRFFWRGKK